jgi:phosphatidylserine decarboxylase
LRLEHQLSLWQFVRLLPKKRLSRLIGFLASCKLPIFLRKKVISITVKLLKINLSEAEKSLDEFTSVQSLFTRTLKPELRPVEGEFVSPVDGCCLYARNFKGDQILQIKDIYYSLNELLGLDKNESLTGCFYHFYLSPKDYHHIHTPCSCSVKEVRHYSGELWPVNLWSLVAIKNLFVRNERVVLKLYSEIYGTFFMVLVGATNVGSIRLSFDERILGNSKKNLKKKSIYSYETETYLKVGEKLGSFLLGSTVLLFFLNFTQDEKLKSLEGKNIKFGESIIY